ncbi:MAG: TIGR04283 family arsenosugar biosynthesis glycosyltransferase [Deltaproteobacteria bacterium]|nr:TIGR04283 family arsenosugar biosynthesis glycosyltransferase [Deltaproteobacteria bacterium]
MSDPFLSVIIPTLNEEKNILRVIDQVQSVRGVEIIVADGGSVDLTLKLIGELRGIRVFNCPPQRARQLNLGARHAQGEYLLFLHADTLLPLDYTHEIQKILAQPGTVAGAFGFKSDLQGWGMILIEKLVAFRSRILKMPYGDQGIFMKKAVFEELGGFPEISVMEDFQMVLNLKKIGRISISKAFAVTSGRKWEEDGLIRVTIRNQRIILAYLRGVPAEKIKARFGK